MDKTTSQHGGPSSEETSLGNVHACFASTPELKLEKRLKIRVEPGVFEWMKWEASKATPTFLSLEELTEAHFNVDPDYR